MVSSHFSGGRGGGSENLFGVGEFIHGKKKVSFLML